MLEYRYDTQLLIDGDDLDEDEVADYFTENFKGDCLLAVGGDGDPIKIGRRIKFDDVRDFYRYCK